MSIAQEIITGKVIKAADGDTTILTSNHTQVKIHYTALNCPEKRQDFGTKAKQFASDLYFRKTVSPIEFCNNLKKE